MSSNSRQPKLTGRAFYESLGSPKYVLAPMVDQSEFAWRLLSRSFLPPSQQSSLLAYTPMLHARLFKQTQSYRDHHFQSTRNAPPPSSAMSEPNLTPSPYLDGHQTHDRPLIVQFCANDPEDFLQAAQHVSPYCDAVDLNLGCPQGIARKGRYGSFLQESPNLIHSLVSKLANNLDVPVTAKMRVLNTKEETLQYAKLLLDAGASWIAVHGRRREQKGHETGLADWNVIRYLRDSLPKETVIFANGNILGHEDLDRCLEMTGADGVMSAEGNLCDPAIFATDEGRLKGEETGEYWKGKDGKAGWRMDAVLRRYLDILYKFVLEKDPPIRPPLYVPNTTLDASQQIAQPPPESPLQSPIPETPDNAAPPPSKKRKHNQHHPRPTSPNLLAVQPHLFHLLRPLLSTHTAIRDKLARARPGDMPAYEEILSMVETVTRQGMLEYDKQDPEMFPDKLVYDDGEQKDKTNEEESSARAVLRCKRPWWICQAYVRPLPKEALEKGSLSLGKKERRRLELEKEDKRKRERDVAMVKEGKEEARQEEDQRDGVPREEVAKEAMVCG
ncbi:MAG: hypothetical protein Q9220_004304 [cf. Caloplaca sp. 1 TL-2023]